MIEPDHLHHLITATHALATDGVAGLDGEALCEIARSARRLQELAEHLVVQSLGALDETGHTDQELGHRTAVWFGLEARVPVSVGHAQLKTARMLRNHLQGTAQAWLDGTISREQVRAMVEAANPRIRDQVAAAEADLIGLTDGRSFAEWRSAIGRVVAAFDQDGPDPDDPEHTTASYTRSGQFAELRARFAGADAEVLEQIINLKIDELFHRNRNDREQSADFPALTRAQLRGQAIAELLRDGHTATADKANRVGVMLVLRATDTNHHGSANHDAGGWPVFTDPLWTLTNPGGHHLALEHFAALLCDCTVHPLLVDADGNPLELGTEVRFFTTRQRRVAIVRDGDRCVFPGCDRPATDFHHVQPYEQGGPTDVVNCAGLCRSHHGVGHRNGWAMHATTDNWFWWQTPSGDTFWSQRHGKQRAGPAPPHHQTAVAA